MKVVPNNILKKIYEIICRINEQLNILIIIFVQLKFFFYLLRR